MFVAGYRITNSIARFFSPGSTARPGSSVVRLHSAHRASSGAIIHYANKLLIPKIALVFNASSENTTKSHDSIAER